ncbi:MAG: MarR family transcriptional regulator [Alphaproteobacteria bacterium]|nr:MarR family transcriptional regulator [Alphaproteobacteria bacterium]
MPYPDAHRLSGAFLANRLDRLADLIVAQGEALLGEAGLNIPSRTVSLLLLVGDHGELSAADAATLLGHPHQLVTQRTELLIGLSLIARKNDPSDRRRKILTLSAKGKAQYARLQIRLAEAAAVFTALFDEIACDLSAMAAKAQAALERRPLLERIMQNAPRKRVPA